MNFIELIDGPYTHLLEQNKPLFDTYGFMLPTQFVHHNYIEMEKFLKIMNTTYRDIVHLYSIGKSVQGRELYVLALGNTPKQHVAGIHLSVITTTLSYHITLLNNGMF